MIFPTSVYHVESIFDGFRTIETLKLTKNHFLTKNLKNRLYNHRHLIRFERPHDPIIRLKILKIKFPNPIFHVEFIFGCFRTIGPRKNG